MPPCWKPTDPTTEEERRTSERIDQEISKDRTANRHEAKLLLLGTGDSGKSTLIKQMKILYLEGFTDEERSEWRILIHKQIYRSVKAVATATRELNITVTKQEPLERVLASQNYGDSFTQFAQIIRDLWADPGIQEAFSQSSQFQLNDSTEYYLSNLDRVSAASYVPNDQDILRVRVMTTGVSETTLDIEGNLIRLVDVGGQRAERGKWVHCFQDVTSILYVAALSEYDLKLFEDNYTNRMHESIKLFGEVINNKWFSNTPIMLFLNKKDLFAQKIPNVDLRVCFPEYSGGPAFEKAAEYIEHQYTKQNKNPKRQIYPHLTCATDTKNVEVVFNATRAILLNKALREFTDV